MRAGGKGNLSVAAKKKAVVFGSKPPIHLLAVTDRDPQTSVNFKKSLLFVKRLFGTGGTVHAEMSNAGGVYQRRKKGRGSQFSHKTSRVF
jgi:hypothetical protein